MEKTIGIIGAGSIGKAVATHLVKANHRIIIGNSRGPESLKEIIQALGPNARAGTSAEAAAADIVILALPWKELPKLKDLTDWTNKIVIDASNHYIAITPEFKTADLGPLTSSEVVAGYVPGAHLVKAFNTLYFKILEADPHQAGGRRVLFYAGDNAEAKQTVGALIASFGFEPIDLGPLASGGRLQQALGPLSGKNLIAI